MRYLFLDIDGVINSHQSVNFWHRMRKKGELPLWLRAYQGNDFCPIALSNLEHIMEEVSDLQIVISSTWRLGREVDELKKLFDQFSHLIPKAIIGKTPIIMGERGDEIVAWLKESDALNAQFVVLDDDSDMSAVWDNFFQTDSRVGLDMRTAYAVVNFFNKGQHVTSLVDSLCRNCIFFKTEEDLVESVNNGKTLLGKCEHIKSRVNLEGESVEVPEDFGCTLFHENPKIWNIYKERCQ